VRSSGKRAGDISLRRRFVEQFNAAIQRFIERLFLNANDILDVLFPGADFRKNVAHRFGQHIHKFVKERLVKTERTAIAHGAAEDAAQDIIAVRVAGLNAVGNGKAQSTDMVGNDAEGHVDGELRFEI